MNFDHFEKNKSELKFKGIIAQIYNRRFNRKTFEYVVLPDTVRVVAVTEDKKILLLKEKVFSFDKTYFSLPGGSIEENETPQLDSLKFQDNNMIDTIVVRIVGLEKFTVLRPDLFRPEFKPRTYADLSMTERNTRGMTKRKLMDFVLRPGPQDLYVPRVEIHENLESETRSVTYTLRIEFSVPKLLFEQSICEISDSQYLEAKNVLLERLVQIGVKVNSWRIDGAEVTKVHFAKNIILPPHVKFREITTELEKIDIGLATAIEKAKYINQAECLHLHTGVREYVFYDKVREMMKPKSKSREKERAVFERGILDVLDLKSTEIFRYEYRLIHLLTLRSEINKILGRSHKTTVCFKDLFSLELWKTILIKSWKEILQRPENQTALLGNSDEIGLFFHAINEQGTSAHSQNAALNNYVLAMTIKKHGAKAIKDELSRKWSQRSGTRLKDKLTKAAKWMEGFTYSDRIAFIDKELEKFEQITLDFLHKRVELQVSSKI